MNKVNKAVISDGASGRTEYSGITFPGHHYEYNTFDNFYEFNPKAEVIHIAQEITPTLAYGENPTYTIIGYTYKYVIFYKEGE